MRYLLISVLALLAILFIAPRYTAHAELEPEFVTTYSPTYAVVVYPPPPPPTREGVRLKVYHYAEKYGANGYQMWTTISTCENTGLDPKLQSYHKSNGPNGREDSWGLAQINLPSHPHITREQAQDPDFSLDFMAREFAAGRERKWTCWRNIFGVPLSPTATSSEV